MFSASINLISMVGRASCSDRKTQRRSFHQYLLDGVVASFAQISLEGLVLFNLSFVVLVAPAREYSRKHVSITRRLRIQLKS